MSRIWAHSDSNTCDDSVQEKVPHLVFDFDKAHCLGDIDVDGEAIGLESHPGVFGDDDNFLQVSRIKMNTRKCKTNSMDHIHSSNRSSCLAEYSTQIFTRCCMIALSLASISAAALQSRFRSWRVASDAADFSKDSSNRSIKVETGVVYIQERIPSFCSCIAMAIDTRISKRIHQRCIQIECCSRIFRLAHIYPSPLFLPPSLFTISTTNQSFLSQQEKVLSHKRR